MPMADQPVESIGRTASADLGAIASVSHELRAPLHAIVGLSELMIEANLEERERELATAIHREGQALQFIIDDLLDLSKISAGKMTLQTEPFSPRAVLDEVATMFQPNAAAKDLSLVLIVDDDLPLAVRGDRYRLRQVLVNLVSNAVKYTDDGSVTITARFRTGHEGREESLDIDVADTGPGIPNAALADLFVPFKQARNRDHIKGTGLGLSITQQLCELMNGEIDLATSPDGTTFSVRVPVLPARRLQDRIIAARQEHGARVLIVDDADVNRMVARSQLERLGHHPVEAANGPDALALLSAEHFDAVLMDWHMPHQDGLETVRLYRQWATEHDVTAPPIIMMTADVSAHARETCAAAGTDDFLPKPVSLNDLDTCLQRWLSAEAATDTVESSAYDGTVADRRVTSERGPVIDRSVLDQMIVDLGGPDAVVLIIATFADDAAERRLTLRATGVTDPEAAKRAAHTLKSTAAMLGAAALSQTCQRLESQLAEHTHADPDDIAAFNAQLDASITELQSIALELTRNASGNTQAAVTTQGRST